jgi:N-methylhydantoinase B/oxoprolinase/acetone carboxylase alpha subunit
MAGGRRHQVRQPRGAGGALSPCISGATSFARQRRDGRHRGGPGGELELIIETSEPALGNTAGDGVKYGACGLNGGENGKPHLYWLQSAGRADRRLKTKEIGIVLRPGDVVHAHSGVAAAGARPASATAEERERDQALGFVSGKGAERCFGSVSTSAARSRTLSA